MKRTTIYLPESLLSETKKLAAGTGRTLTGVIEDALREVLARKKRSKRASKPVFTTFSGKGLQPGVDLDNSAALLDLMESR